VILHSALRRAVGRPVKALRTAEGLDGPGRTASAVRGGSHVQSGPKAAASLGSPGLPGHALFRSEEAEQGKPGSGPKTAHQSMVWAIASAD